jgi:tetratricopeptide (TPR) repeat protein
MSQTGVNLTDVQATRITIRGVTVGYTVEELVAALEARGLLPASELAGLQRRMIITLAKRLKPDERLDFDQALTELERAVEVALDVIARGERGTNDDAFVNAVLARVAENIRSEDLDGGARAVDDGLAELKAGYQRSQVALLEEGVTVDILRRDAVSVARRIENLVSIKQPVERSAWRGEFRKRFNVFYEDGKQRGINFSLSVAVELARRMLARSRDGVERGSAAALVGRALRHLGKREVGTERLEQALIAFQEALEEQKRDLVPLEWAATQNRIGLTLLRLGEREAGTERLEQAVEVFREALSERKREIVPLEWAQTQNNLGAAFMYLSQRKPGREDLNQAKTAFQNALEEWKEEVAPDEWAIAQRNLTAAVASIAKEDTSIGGLLSLLGGSTWREGQREELEQAVIAHNKMLETQTRELVPLAWAMTHYNIGDLLLALGKREFGTQRLEQAVTAYRNALTVYTRENMPFDWAKSQNNLGNALQLLGERKAEAGLIEQAVMAYDRVLAVLDPTSNEYYTNSCRANRNRALARLAQQQG